MHLRRDFRSAVSILITSMFVGISALAAEPIQIAREVPYMDPTTVSTNILGCDLGTRFAASVQKFTQKYGIETRVVDELDPNAKGRVLQVQITSVTSRGNAFIGHHKSMAAKGELFVDGVSQAFVNFSRDSSGGFGAGFKGSCSVLARCSHTLGNDLAKWLKKQN